MDACEGYDYLGQYEVWIVEAFWERTPIRSLKVDGLLGVPWQNALLFRSTSNKKIFAVQPAPKAAKLLKSVNAVDYFQHPSVVR